MTWDCFKDHIKMEYQKIINLLGATPNEMSRFITKKIGRISWSVGWC